MVNPGDVLEGRYEILEIIGTGGMSTVYKAKDTRLNRFVAIKVLKSEYSADMNFVTKFRNEAQASAGLSHPNIVQVYDVSEDSGQYYIVMELVEGITLKEYVAINGRLSMDQAIDFSIQIASGLEVAHNNHIIHRDIKPQNIIVSKNGNLKVTDFGIAKAATSNTMSTLGMGSVHYISPEQARGGYSDERSDIYSLGITMYEMVTGKVPFEGETNVAIALKHINNEIVPPRQVCPDIYSSLEKVIMKATQKKPEKRYLTATALIADLRRVKANPNIDIVVAGSGVTSAPTQKFTTEDLEEIKTASKNAPLGSNSSEEKSIKTPPQADRNARLERLLREEDDDDYFDEDDDYEEVRPRGGSVKKVPDSDEYYDDDYDEDDEDGVSPKLEKAVMIAGVAAAIIIALIILLLVGQMLNWFDFGKSKEVSTDTSTETEEEVKVQMIDIVGYTREGAEKKLKEAKFTNYRFVEESSDKVQEGYVISTEPESGEEIGFDDEITVHVSLGPETVKVPDVAGKTEQEADAILKDSGFTPTHSYRYDDEVEKDLVLETSPKAGEDAKEGSVITVYISNGKEVKTAKVPKLTDMSQTAAKSSLEAVGLELGNVTTSYSDTVEKGIIISQSVSEGTEVTEGTKVDIVISDGKKTVTYTAKVGGTLTASQDYFESIAQLDTVTFTVKLQGGGIDEAVFTQTVAGADASAINVDSSKSGLSSNGATVSFTVTGSDGSDLTPHYSSSLALSYTEE